jgi:tetratricopeptide (TPR) repeat protein
MATSRGIGKSLNAICVLLGLLVVFGIFRVWANSTAPASSQPTPSPSLSASKPAQTNGSADVTIQNLKQDEEVLEKEISTEDKLLAAKQEEISRLNDFAKFLMTAVGVFAIILGLASWKALDDQRKAASENLDLQKENLKLGLDAALDESRRSLEGVNRLRDELQHDFPMFGRMRSKFSNILHGLQLACVSLRLEDATYSTLRWDEEQRILFYENAISTALLLDTTEYVKQLSEIYRLLGTFYGSKYHSTQGSGKSNERQSDFNRARFYFDRSIEFNPENYFSFIYAGHFTQYYDDNSLAELSRGYFQRATVIGPQFQKPWISISLIELEAFKDPDRALAALERAISNPEYDMDSKSPKPELVYYLQANAFCLKASKLNGEDRTVQSIKALEKLELSSAHPTQTILDFFKTDKELFAEVLEKNQVVEQQYEQLAIKLSTPL